MPANDSKIVGYTFKSTSVPGGLIRVSVEFDKPVCVSHAAMEETVIATAVHALREESGREQEVPVEEMSEAELFKEATDDNLHTEVWTVRDSRVHLRIYWHLEGEPFEGGSFRECLEAAVRCRREEASE